MLTIEPIAGLGNRMRAMDSALALARDLRSRVRIVWPRTPDLNCRFRDLFERPAGVTISERSWSQARVERTLGRWLRVYGRFLRDSDIESLPHNDARLLDDGPWKSTFIITCRRFYPSPAPYEALRPVDSLRAVIEGYASDFDEHVVGVHLRRTDNTVARTRSPTNAFVREMDCALTKDARTRFFVATDAPEEEELLRRRYPGRIIAHPKVLDRNVPQAARDAVIDLYTLASTSRILGSHWSSFTDTAAELGGVEKIIVSA